MPIPNLPNGCTTVVDRDGEFYDLQPDGLWKRRLTGKLHTLRSIDSLYGPVRPATAEENA